MANNVKIVQWNAASLVLHADELRQYIITSKTKPDLICIAETNLKPNKSIRFEGYQIIRMDRKAKQGGGVAILIKTGLSYRQIHHTFNKIECIIIELYLLNTT